MKRNIFLKSLATLTGGTFILGCDRDMIEALVPSRSLGELSLVEAQDWVIKEYLPQFSTALARMSGKEYKRKLNWDSAKKVKKENGQEFAWVPVESDEDNSLAVISYDSRTEYRRKLPKCYFQPIIEGLIVIEEQGKKKAYLAQIAYDPYALQRKPKLSLADFTGTLLRAEWDNTLLEGRSLVDGKVQRSFKNGSTKGARQAECHQEYYEYQVVTVNSCGQNCTEVTVALHRGYQTVCSEGGDFGGGGAGGEYEPGVGGGSPGDGSGGTGGGGNGGVPLIIPGPTYNLQNAISTPGPDREVFNTLLKNAFYATGLANDITTWNFDVATGLARSVGGDVDEFFQLVRSTGPVGNAIAHSGIALGVVGVAISGAQLYIGVVENGWQLDEDGWNAAQVVLGLGGLALGAFALPWFAAAAGIVSIGIAVTHPPQN